MNEKEFKAFVYGIRPQLSILCQRFFDQTHLTIDPEDVVQETLIKLWKIQGKLNDYKSPAALAIKIAKNLCIDYTRKNAYHNIPIDSCSNVSSVSPPDQNLIGNDMEKQINKALTKLPPTQRKMLNLRSEGMNLDMIATICNASKASTKTMISAARKAMFHLLKENL